MARRSSKERLLDSAEAVAFEGGAAHLTLDAVAAKAGVSKGGVLYHFPTKEALLEGMLSRLMKRNEERRAVSFAEEMPGPQRELRSDIAALLALSKSDGRVGEALLAAVANNPNLMVTVREYQQQRFASCAGEGLEYPERAILLLAAKGLMFLELLRVSPFNEEQRQILLEEMLRQTEEPVGIS